MNHYYLLPFRFERIKEQELLVNELGDFIFVPTGTTERIIKRQLSNQEDLYKDLVANFFISETPIPELIDNIATRLRTKKAFLDSFTSLHIFVLTLTYIIHSGFISGYQNRYGDNLKPPTNVYHRMTA